MRLARKGGRIRRISAMEIDDDQEKSATTEDANRKRGLGHIPFVGLSIIKILKELTEWHVFQREM